MPRAKPVPTDGYQVECLAERAATTLEADWRRLEAEIAPPPFLRWDWFSTWLAQQGGRALVVRVHQGQALVALGAFGLTAERRHGVLRSTVASLHQGGNPRDDQVWVEYNGLLALPGHETAAADAVVTALLASGRCDEVHLSMAPAEQALPGHRHGRVLQEIPGFLRDLGALRDLGKDVLEGLSGNTRYQVRRSLRRYEARHGPPAVEAARTLDEALAFFHRAGSWHRQRWHDSGFANPAFVSFHETLLKRGFGHGTVQLFRVTFGEHVIGVFYFLIGERRAYFYLQGVPGEEDGRLKPGLTGHCLLMQHFLEAGYDSYDFMGGDSQYKRQLADRRQDFIIQRRHNGHWRFRAEDALRRLKQRWQRTRG
ncbi:MAG: GNAT family N-acetyltransferase [Pseudohaliea sp.]